MMEKTNLKVLFLAILLNILLPLCSIEQTLGADATSENTADKIEDKLAEAEAAYRTLLATDKNGDAHVGLVYVLLRHGKLDDAHSVLSEARSKFENHPPNLLAVAGYLSFIRSRQISLPNDKRAGYLSASERFCLTALDKDPKTAQAALTLAMVYAEKENLEIANYYLDQAIAFGYKHMKCQIVPLPLSTAMMVQEYERKAKNALRKKDFKFAATCCQAILEQLGVSGLYFPQFENCSGTWR